MVSAAKDVVLTRSTARVMPVVVVKDGDTIRAYVNSCPHARDAAPIGRGISSFDLSGTYLRCERHSWRGL